MCKVLIADDSDIMRGAIRSRLQDDSSFQIVGEASCFADVIRLMTDSRPDIVILDLSMPEKERFPPELVRAQLSGVATVAVSLANDDAAQSMARSYGATVLLDKITLYADLIPAIREAREDDPQ
jgi:DNA-binding NarL/FixJ family response regulator